MDKQAAPSGVPAKGAKASTICLRVIKIAPVGFPTQNLN